MHHIRNQTRLPNLGKQRGFSLVAAFIVIAILMAVVAYFVAGQGLNTSSAGTYSNSARASSIITQGSYLQGGFTIMTTGGIAPSEVKFDADASKGLFNPSVGGVERQVPDQSSIITNKTALDGFWIYRGNQLGVNSIGTGGNHYGVVLTGLKLGVCEQINQQLHGVTTVTKPGFNVDKVRANADPDNPADIALGVISLSSLGTGWDKGCFETDDNVYVYYHILMAQ
jgi:hypothetical protein